MSFITYPLNNIDYTAEDAELFHCTRTSGIWAEDSFSISVTGADNNVTIGTGIAWINNEEFSGKVAALKSAEVLDLGIADGTYPRIDVIAIQYSTNNNATDVVIKKGTPATNPVRPAIDRSGAVYELYLASVYRPAGATAITASNITDLRMDETVCGLMADSVTKVDMTAIEAQVRAFINNLQSEIDSIKDLSGLMFESEWVEDGFIPASKVGINDYIVEESTNEDGWSYVKYASGLAEMWFRGNIGQVTLRTVVDTNIVSDPFFITFPFRFIEVPYCVVTYEGNSTGYADVQMVNGKYTTVSKSYSIRLVRAGNASISLQDNIVSCYARGAFSFPQ